MSKRFGSVIASPMRAFVRSPLGVRETTSGEFGYLLGDPPLGDPPYGNFGTGIAIRYDSGTDSWVTKRGDSASHQVSASTFAASPNGESRGYRHGGVIGIDTEFILRGRTAEYNPLADTWAARSRSVDPCATGASTGKPTQGFSQGSRDPVPSEPAQKFTQVYAPNTDVWASRLDGPGRSHHDAATVGGIYYINGGRYGTGPTISGQNRSFNADVNSWTVWESMIDVRNNHAAATSPDDVAVYVIQGIKSFEAPRTGSKSVHKYEVMLGSWQTSVTHPIGRAEPSAFSLADGIYTVGGYTTLDDRNPTRDVYRFSSGSWSERQNAPVLNYQYNVTNVGAKI